MSYVVLARKYRPRSFAQMAGQDHVVRALTNALQQQRLHHAYLFTGTRGIGKTTVSRILAKSLNCTGPDGQGGITAEPCGVCTACTEIDADRFIDYIEMDAASNRGIDEVRDMIERAAYKPSVGRFKVFMIDEAHQLTKEAFNALLKTLEEPPAYLKFVLATTDPEKMLPTVLSRCLQFNLRPMAPETVRDHLARVLAAEDVAHDEGALRALARAARGSMRDALSLTDQAIAYGSGRLDEAGVRGMLGLVDGGVPAALLETLARRDGAAMLAHVQELRLRGASFHGLLEQMATLLQRVAVEQAVPGAIADDDDDALAVRQAAGRFAAEEVQLLYSLVLHGRAELALMSDESAAFSMVLLRYLAFPPAGAPSAARAAPLRAPAPARLKVPVPVAPVPVVATTPRGTDADTIAPGAAGQRPVNTARHASESAAPQVAAPSAGPQPASTGADGDADVGADAVADVGADAMAGAMAGAMADADADATAVARSPRDAALSERWNTIVRRLIETAAVSGLVRELAWQSELVGVESSSPVRWTLCVPHEALRTAGLRDKLVPALSEVTGAPLELLLAGGQPQASPAQREAAERQRRQRAAEQLIQDDAVVRELLAQFPSARIVPGSIKPL